MIELDGIQYELKTPQENAESAIAYVNDYCKAHNVKNSHNELVQIEQNWANPLYCIIFGFSYLVTILQKLIYNAGCSLNIARASDRQLLNVAEIANVRRKKATRTTIVVMLYANLSTDTDPVPCLITKDLLVTVNYGGNPITFSPAYETTIPVNGSISMVLLCDQEGSYSIPAGSITSFDVNPQGFRKLISQASIPGQKEESIANLRKRIQERSTTGTQLDRAAIDITQLPGVTLCNIFFNYSNTSETVINGIIVPPRQSLLFVQGYSDDISRVFYNHLSCITAGKDYQYAIKQDYETHAGQKISVYIIPPTVVYPQIRIFIGEKIISEVRQGVKDAIASLSEEMSIGEVLTSTKIINKIQSSYPQLSVSGVQLALEDNVFSYQVQAQEYQLFQFDDSKISIIEPQNSDD